MSGGHGGRAQVFISSVWTLPKDLSTFGMIDGLVLAFHHNLNGYPRVLRVLLQDAVNCFYDVLIPQDSPAEYILQRSFCSTTAFRKIVPDSNVDMRDVRNILLVSFGKVVVLSVDSLQQVAFAKVRHRHPASPDSSSLHIRCCRSLVLAAHDCVRW